LLSATALAAAQVAKRSADEKAIRRAWSQLSSSASRPAGNFDPVTVAHLPEPARRYFQFTIQSGARLGTVVEISMQGELSLGTRQDPKFKPMRAEQLLAAPQGLLWRVQTRIGALPVSGSDGMIDGDSWTRFWLLGVVPVVRAGGNTDHLRSSFGRVIAEAAFWAPASLLPQPGVTWSAVDADTARATVTHAGLSQEVDIRVDANGVFRVQPFGGELSEFRTIDGFRLPFRVDGGNFFGTPDYFPFYRARVLSIHIL
jgi:hypothetical protein